MNLGATVYLFEKTNRMGGNSEKASSGMNAAQTATQAKLWEKDSVEEFYACVFLRPIDLCSPQLVITHSRRTL